MQRSRVWRKSNETRLTNAFVFFFFQAEDGIRDYKVTGVQTCALPISPGYTMTEAAQGPADPEEERTMADLQVTTISGVEDRKSTRLNSSHLVISYAVFCLKKKNEVFCMKVKIITIYERIEVYY